MLDHVDTGSLPLTEPHSAPIFDTGPHPEPLVSYDDVDYAPPADLDALMSASPALVVPPQVVPGQFMFVKRWKFAVLLAAVWLAAGIVGLGLYYWWFHAFDKTWPDAGVLGFVIVCIVAALLVSMTEAKPMASALALAVMSAPFAAMCAAGALYGSYAFGLISP